MFGHSHSSVIEGIRAACHRAHAVSCRLPTRPKICGLVFGSASSFGQSGIPVGAVFADVQQPLHWRRSGPEVTGPAEATLMAVAGRRSALADLSGDGLPVLAGRVTVPRGAG